MYKVIFLAGTALVLIATVSGCSARSAVTTGTTPQITQSTLPVGQMESPNTTVEPITSSLTPEQPYSGIQTVADIIENSQAYKGKDVIVEGKIVQECGAGCWFNLKDSTGIIYVDLAPSNLAIPQKVGSKAKVYGTVDIKSGITYIIGKKVEF